MKLLAVDTSTEQASIALHYEGKILSKEHPARQQHAQNILPTIDALLKEAGLSLKQLDALVLGRGPGSFTGLRVALSLVKGLAFAHDLPVYPVSTLEAIVEELRFLRPDLSEKGVLAVMDARMNQLYWTSCRPHETIFTEERVSCAKDLSIDGLAPMVLAGLGFEAYRKDLPKALLATIEDSIEVYPRASAMLRLVLAGAIPAVSANEALPTYVRNQVVSGSS